MIILGLTGGIGMGKTTLANQLAQMGAKICNADAIVHRLMAKDGAAVELVGKAFPGVIKNGAVNRSALGDIVFKQPEKMKQLEDIIHPLVVAEENQFIERMHRLGAKLVVLDIPLLFETGAESRCHFTLLASAPHFVQLQRVLKRPGMTEDKFAHIVEAQMPDEEKRQLADMVIDTGLGKAYSYRKLANWIRELQHEA